MFDHGSNLTFSSTLLSSEYEERGQSGTKERDTSHLGFPYTYVRPNWQRSRKILAKQRIHDNLQGGPREDPLRQRFGFFGRIDMWVVWVAKCVLSWHAACTSAEAVEVCVLSLNVRIFHNPFQDEECV